MNISTEEMLQKLIDEDEIVYTNEQIASIIESEKEKVNNFSKAKEDISDKTENKEINDNNDLSQSISEEDEEDEEETKPKEKTKKENLEENKPKKKTNPTFIFIGLGILIIIVLFMVIQVFMSEGKKLEEVQIQTQETKTYETFKNMQNTSVEQEKPFLENKDLEERRRQQAQKESEEKKKIDLENELENNRYEKLSKVANEEVNSNFKQNIRETSSQVQLKNNQKNSTLGKDYKIVGNGNVNNIQVVNSNYKEENNEENYHLEEDSTNIQIKELEERLKQDKKLTAENEKLKEENQKILDIARKLEAKLIELENKKQEQNTKVEPTEKKVESNILRYKAKSKDVALNIFLVANNMAFLGGELYTNETVSINKKIYEATFNGSKTEYYNIEGTTNYISVKQLIENYTKVEQ